MLYNLQQRSKRPGRQKVFNFFVTPLMEGVKRGFQSWQSLLHDIVSGAEPANENAHYCQRSHPKIRRAGNRSQRFQSFTEYHALSFTFSLFSSRLMNSKNLGINTLDTPNAYENINGRVVATNSQLSSFVQINCIT